MVVDCDRLSRAILTGANDRLWALSAVPAVAKGFPFATAGTTSFGCFNSRTVRARPACTLVRYRRPTMGKSVTISAPKTVPNSENASHTATTTTKKPIFAS